MRLRGLYYIYILQSFTCEKFLVWRELFVPMTGVDSETERVILYYKVLPVKVFVVGESSLCRDDRSWWCARW